MAALYYSTPIDGGVDFHVIEFDATISEKHTQDATLTEHAIGRGGHVSDHIRTAPQELSFAVAVSNIPHTLSPRGRALSFDGSEPRPRQAYETMLSLMRAAQLMDVVCGLTDYSNVVITSVSAPQNVDADDVVVIDVSMREVRIATTQTVAARPRQRRARAETQAAAQPTQTPTQGERERMESLLHRGNRSLGGGA